MNIVLKPNDRIALLGKTGGGKSLLAMVLAGTYAITLPAPWEVWWIDTKGDADDIRQLRQWGARNMASQDDWSSPGTLGNLGYFKLKKTIFDGSKDMGVVAQAQAIFAAAYQRGHVIIFIDEYTQVVVSARSPGSALRELFAQGRGLNIGVVGCTQEPVFIPRQLISQSTHLVMLNLTFAIDIKYVKTMFPQYVKPASKGDPYGFWWSYNDGPSEDTVTYFKSQKDWFDTLKISIPSGIKVDLTQDAKVSKLERALH